MTETVAGAPEFHRNRRTKSIGAFLVLLILLAVVLVIGAPMIIRFIVQGSLW